MESKPLSSSANKNFKQDKTSSHPKTMSCSQSPQNTNGIHFSFPDFRDSAFQVSIIGLNHLCI